MTRFKVGIPIEQANRVRMAMLEAMKAEAADLRADEVLAIAAYTVGHLIALQDQRRFTLDTILELVAANIKEGKKPPSPPSRQSTL